MTAKSCKECGESFIPKQKTQLFCSKTHFRKCQNPSCGKLFEVQRRRLNSNQMTCDPQCAGAYRKVMDPKLEDRSCAECGTTFVPSHFNELYCSKAHLRICENCGKSYPVDRSKLSKATRACGQSCGSALSHSEEGRTTRKKNSLERYGVEHHFQREDVKAQVRNHPAVKSTLYGSEGFKQNMISKHGVENGFQLPNAVPGRISKPNLHWQKLLEELTGANWELERFFAEVGNVDLYAEANGMKLAVEISPTATHNSHIHRIACTRRGCEVFPCGDHGKPRDYHQQKVTALRELHGVELITVFDWMDGAKLLNFIKAKLRLLPHRIGAKRCELREITQKEANSFLRDHHLLGASRLQTRCYGLFFEGELLQVQTYAPRKKSGSWEAKRLATREGWSVMGGVSRATKRFIADEDPEEIVAFTDLNLGFGSGFDSLHNGFSLRELQKPVLCWSKGDRMILQKSAAFQSADRLIGIAKDSKTSPYPEDWTNGEVFLAEGWLPVWDCGKIKETWRKDEL